MIHSIFSPCMHAMGSEERVTVGGESVVHEQGTTEAIHTTALRILSMISAAVSSLVFLATGNLITGGIALGCVIWAICLMPEQLSDRYERATRPIFRANPYTTPLPSLIPNLFPEIHAPAFSITPPVIVGPQVQVRPSSFGFQTHSGEVRIPVGEESPVRSSSFFSQPAAASIQTPAPFLFPIPSLGGGFVNSTTNNPAEGDERVRVGEGLCPTLGSLSTLGEQRVRVG